MFSAILNPIEAVERVQSHFKFVTLNSTQQLVIDQDLVSLGGDNQQIEHFPDQKDTLNRLELGEYTVMLWFKINEDFPITPSKFMKIDLVSFDQELNCYLQLNTRNAKNQRVNEFVCEHEFLTAPNHKLMKRMRVQVDPVVPLLDRWLHLTLASYDYETMSAMHRSGA
jgi:hypothetical protein